MGFVFFEKCTKIDHVIREDEDKNESDGSP
jgi:hypothetical protein